jgi:hypothetical protein
MLIENLDFNGSNDITQKIEPEPEGSSDIYKYVPELPEPEIKPPQIQMDFSTPISDVVPSAEFESAGPYKNPTNDKVTALSLDNATTVVKSSSKNPFGLTNEQLQATVAGIAAVIAFSKPVQSKLSSFIPNFEIGSGSLSLTGMIASAFVVAVIYFLTMSRLV